MVFVGPSGCAKSTLLRMIAGLESVSEGQILIHDRCVNDSMPKDRGVAMVFQNYALYPHMTVYKNMAFGLLGKESKAEIDRRVRDAAEKLEITNLLQRKPASSPAASASEWQSAAPSCASPRCSCSMSRCPTSTPSCGCRCACS